MRRCILADGRIAAAEAARVVSDDERGLLLWLASGSTVVRRTTSDGTAIRKMSVQDKYSVPTFLAPSEWYGHGVLILTPPDAGHSVWWFFHDDGSFRGWYINLEVTRARWASGFDMQDQALDVWIWPDHGWKWKDEDEFAERTGHPLYWTSEQAPAIRAEGERMVAVAQTGAYPFDGVHLDFKPDPHWGPSILPTDWDQPQCP